MSSIRSRDFRSEARPWWAVAVVFLIGRLVWTGLLWAGTLEIRIKDHREAIGDFSKLNITIDKIRIRERSALPILGGTWVELRPTANVVDLTRYTDGRSARVFRGELEPAEFEAFDLKVKKISGVLKKKKTTVEPKNSLGAIKLAFSVTKSGETRIVLDLGLVQRALILVYHNWIVLLGVHLLCDSYHLTS